MGMNGERRELRNRLVPAPVFSSVFSFTRSFLVREYLLLRVNYLCVIFLKYVLIVVQVSQISLKLNLPG